MGVGDTAKQAILSYVALGKEATFGTYASATTAIEALSCGFEITYDSQRIDAMGYNRGWATRVRLGKHIKGTLEQYLHPQESVLLITNALAGQISSTAATNSTLHSISAGNFGNSIASLSFNVRKGDQSQHTWRYVGGRINQLKIAAEVGQPVKCTYDVIFQDASFGTDDISGILSISSVQPFTFVGAQYRYGGSEGAVTTESVQGFELTINNNLKSDKSVGMLGTDTIQVLPATRRTIDFKVTARFDTTTAYNRFIQSTEGAAILYFSGAAAVANTTVSEYFMTLQINLPRIVQKTGDPILKGPGDIIEVEQQFDVLLDVAGTTTGRDIGLTWRNTTASY